MSEEEKAAAPTPVVPEPAPPGPAVPPVLASAATTEEEEPGDGPLRVFFGLFLVPLLVVLVCVAVFVGFGWVAYERNTINDYLNDLNSGWRPRRAQAAYELSKILLADPEALASDPGAQAEVRRQFQEADDEVMRRYLALILGRSGDPEAIPLLIDALDDDDSQTRIYALMALGEAGDPRAMTPLVASLQDSDPGIRKTAAWALGEMGDTSAAPVLIPALEDPVADVRWNAALALARFGDPRAVPVLEQIVDRQLSSQVADITPEQQEEAMIQAVGALAVLQREEALPLLDTLAEEDPSMKVRQAALEAKRLLAGDA